MKTWSMGVILLTLVAAPVNARMVSNEEPDVRAQCGMTLARIIVSGAEDTIVSPDDVNVCKDVDGGAGSDAENDMRPIPAKDANKSERALDLAILASQPLIVSPR
jgi:hypothetical protein